MLTNQTDAFPECWYQMGDDEHFWIKWRWRVWLKLMAHKKISMAIPERALDVGCGVGTFSREVESISPWVVDGVEPNQHAIDSHRGGRGKVYQIDFLKLDFSSIPAYNHVFMFDVLEHLDNPKDYIFKAGSGLRAGGYLHVNVPALPQIHSPYDDVVGHRTRYTLTTLREMFTNTQFNVSFLSYWGLTLLPFGLMRKWMLSRISGKDKIVQIGFSPPNKIAHLFLHSQMWVETSLFPFSPIGTSVMALAQKK
jgi:SAM-dependent methyltransferase